MTGRTEDTGSPDWEEVARIETHPLRLAIIEAMSMDGGRTLSPAELSYELQEFTRSISDINYHMTKLKKAKLVRLAHTRPVRGALEHFYCLTGHSAADLAERLRLRRGRR
jgi:helix-turn-helix protein